jgi:photosynthetic reaction center cytochrome c subunit
MHQQRVRTFFAAAALAGLMAAAPHQARAEEKTAEQVFKNIVALKGTPADQLMPAMQFVAASLGVNCEFCHVAGKMDLDDKGPKRAARAMMAMQAAINKDNFRGRVQVTCYSCHRGSTRPVNMPPVLEADAAPHAEMRPPASSPVTADAILEKYVTALGGADAIRKVASRVEKGKLLMGSNEMPIEVFAKAPNKRVSISNDQMYTAFDGAAGWMGSTGRPARAMSAAESAAAGLDAEFYLPLRLKDLYPQLRRGRPEEAGGVECEVLMGMAPGLPALRLYFDKTSGLLVREVRSAETPLGRMPTQIDYADYRESGGVKIPFRWTLARPNGRFTIQVTDVQNNAPIDDARFVKPEGELK